VNDGVLDLEIPIAALNQYAYCPHRCWRMYCAGEFEENLFTIEGTGIHERVHQMGSGSRGETWQVRSVWLRSERWGLIGKADLIEEREGVWIPVEYKRGARGEWDNDAVQVCAQALCLEEMLGQEIQQGYVYYAQSHQRQLIELDATLREETIAIIRAVGELLRTGTRPPAVYSPRCQGCSLLNACLPRAAERVAKYREEA